MINDYYSINIGNKVADISNEFEQNNSDLKRLYFIRNIVLFNEIVKKINGNCGSFGTGYPFLALKSGLNGELPIIKEQIRYNNELVDAVSKSKHDIWPCSICLSQNYHNMPDLKQICKPCTLIEDSLKPRKFINRLPDIDMWMVCDEDFIDKAKQDLISLLDESGMNTSDLDPVKTIFDMEEITEDLTNGRMPQKFLPLDAHIIDYSTIFSLIEQVPSILEQASINGEAPYLPIHPLSYRKEWQHDDVAYNFIYDYLSAFTEYNFGDELKQILYQTRNIVASGYSFEELYNFLISSCTEGNKRRNKSSMVLRKRFEDRVNLWKK